MIEVLNLTKRYGKSRGVQDVSFTINKGEIVGFLGPNGAGKSTTMNIITGYLSATSGSVRIAGFDILEEPMEAKKHIGYLPEQPPLYLDMTVYEYLTFLYELKKVKTPKTAHLDAICAVVKIADVKHRIIKNLSKGYRQRVGIAGALVGDPDVLILDEPTVGLDPKQIIDIRDLVKDLGRSHTVILSSHILSEIQAVCERVLVINEGRLLVDDTPQNLQKEMSGAGRILLRVKKPCDGLVAQLQNIKTIKSVLKVAERELGAEDFVIETYEDIDARADVLSCVLTNGFTLLGIARDELTLEQIFLKLTEKVQKGTGAVMNDKTLDKHEHNAGEEPAADKRAPDGKNRRGQQKDRRGELADRRVVADRRAGQTKQTQTNTGAAQDKPLDGNEKRSGLERRAGIGDRRAIERRTAADRRTGKAKPAQADTNGASDALDANYLNTLAQPLKGEDQGKI